MVGLVNVERAAPDFVRYNCVEDSRFQHWPDAISLKAHIEKLIRDDFGAMFEIGVDALPDGARDIRDLIEDPPAMVFVIVGSEGEINYCGIK